MRERAISLESNHGFIASQLGSQKIFPQLLSGSNLTSMKLFPSLLRVMLPNFRPLRFASCTLYVLGSTLLKSTGTEIMQVEIVTWGFTNPTSFGTFLWSEKPVAAGVAYLRKTYNRTFGVSLSYVMDNDSLDCAAQAERVELLMSRWYYQRRVSADLHVMIGPGCIEGVALNRLAAPWNILMITSAISEKELRDKTLSPTRISVSPVPYHGYTRLFINLLQRYKWTTVYFLYDQGCPSPALPKFLDEFTSALKKLSGMQYTAVFKNSRTGIDYELICEEFSRISRVMVFLGGADILRKFMIHAASWNMTNGEYVYITLEYLHSGALGNFTWQGGDGQDAIAKEAYRSLLILGPDDSVYAKHDLAEKWFHQTVLGFTKSDHLLTPTVLNSTIHSKPDFNFKNGSLLAQQFCNHSWLSHGDEIFIDETGERVVTLVVRDLSRASGSFEIIIFQEKSTLQLYEVSTMEWVNVENLPPPNEPICGYRGDRGPCATGSHIGRIVGPSVAVLLACIVGATLLLMSCLSRNHATDTLRGSSGWILRPEDISLEVEQGLTKTSLKEISPKNMVRHGRALYKQEPVWVTCVEFSGIHKASPHMLFEKASLKALSQLQRINHENINSFIGLCFENGRNLAYFVWKFCERGSLADCLPVFNALDFEVRGSLILDFLCGLDFVHRSPFGFHGELKDTCCLIDKRFTLKISRLGLACLRKKLHAERSRVGIWCPPELVDKVVVGNKYGDLYCAALIVYEIIALLPPKKDLVCSPAADFVREMLPLFPYFSMRSRDAQGSLLKMLWRGFNGKERDRPSANELLNTASKSLETLSTGIVQRMLGRLEYYAEILESEVSFRTEALVAERNRCDNILKEILPRAVVDGLRSGQKIPAEAFESVSIVFSHLYGFDYFVGQKTPLEVTSTLDNLYSIFDPIVDTFDVYKLDTVGDIYMVSSGVPSENGLRHAREVCLMTSSLRSAFCVDYGTEGSLQFTAGIHSGPCAAGIVGTKTLRFCLFGDTVNTAARMNSYSQPGQIHVSAYTANLLSNDPSFSFSERGFIEMKGIGLQRTYWLMQAAHLATSKPSFSTAIKSETFG